MSEQRHFESDLLIFELVPCVFKLSNDVEYTCLHNVGENSVAFVSRQCAFVSNYKYSLFWTHFCISFV